MRNTLSFWSLCEALPGLAAVMSEWMMYAGEDFPGARSFLRPRQQYAQSILCNRTPGCRCYHRAVGRDDGKIDAVCTCDFGSCAPFNITKEDLVVYELDCANLCRALCTSMGLSPAGTRISDIYATYHIGDYYPHEGCRFPAYLTIQHDNASLHSVLHRLCNLSEKPFILLIPTRDMLDLQSEQTLLNRGSLCLFLQDIACVQQDGSIELADAYRKSMRDFHARVIPSENRVAFFPTPPGTKWGEVRMKFPDNDHTTISVGEVVRRFNFSEIGMRDRRDNKRTKQWHLLQEIARNGGVLDRSVGDPSSNKKQKHELSEKLRRILRIEGDPFFYDEESGCWKCLIRLNA